MSRNNGNGEHSSFAPLARFRKFFFTHSIADISRTGSPGRQSVTFWQGCREYLMEEVVAFSSSCSDSVRVISGWGQREDCSVTYREARRQRAVPLRFPNSRTDLSTPVSK